MGDRHLEAATEELDGRTAATMEQARHLARKALAAHYDSLLGELPEEAVEAADKAFWREERDVNRATIIGFLRSLRDSLASGQGQGQRHEG